MCHSVKSAAVGVVRAAPVFGAIHSVFLTYFLRGNKWLWINCVNSYPNWGWYCGRNQEYRFLHQDHYYQDVRFLGTMVASLPLQSARANVWL